MLTNGGDVVVEELSREGQEAYRIIQAHCVSLNNRFPSYQFDCVNFKSVRRGMPYLCTSIVCHNEDMKLKFGVMITEEYTYLHIGDFVNSTPPRDIHATDESLLDTIESTLPSILRQKAWPTGVVRSEDTFYSRAPDLTSAWHAVSAIAEIMCDSTIQ